MDSSKPGPNLVWILKATSTMCFATSFSVMGVTSVSRKGAKAQRKTAKEENQITIHQNPNDCIKTPVAATVAVWCPRKTSSHLLANGNARLAGAEYKARNAPVAPQLHP